ncbi:MAG: disulfide oxidoreductase, partial [Pseudomonadota bacterium]
DTEIDYTEQGGLMWGEHAVGKLVAGSDVMKPTVQAFVDDEAGADVAQKVQRRLQHFIDRKIALLFEPLLNLSRDEALSGLARGFAFQMVEALGVIPRDQVADDVKALDQDARGALRKHGIRFGQFTIFMPLLLKPAPTRLRLVLWSLAKGLQEFPESPPPGLVTIPTVKDAPEGAFTMSGYRAAGERAIRIDMLERLADMLRACDSRGGFEATADMLSISGTTLEQFAGLMEGLGYAAEKGEREKVKPVTDAVAETADGAASQSDGDAAETPVMDAAPDMPTADVAPVEETPSEETPAIETPDAPETQMAAAETGIDPVEMEVFYIFRWGRKPQGQRRPQGDKPRGKGKGKPRGGPKGKPQGAKTFNARPPKKEKAIDPDNPFAAALMGLKDGK